MGSIKAKIASVTGKILVLECESLPELDKTKDYEVTMKEWKESRSLRQNRFLWALIHEIDQKENGYLSDEMAVYRNLIKLAKIRTEYLMLTREAVEELKRRSVFRYIEEIEERKTEKGEAIVIRCYYGSSTFDTKEMTDFIEATLFYAEKIGINTLKYSYLRQSVEEMKGD